MTLGPLPIDYIIQSNLIEGIKEIEEIPKTKAAWTYLSSVDRLTKTNVLDIHRLVMIDILWPEDVGVYRSTNVRVGGRSCPNSILVRELMDEWLQTMRHWQDLDPKRKHIDFEHIHPFRDGNGRIGRLLMWWHEAMLGVPLTLITYEDRFSYYEWF